MTLPLFDTPRKVATVPRTREEEIALQVPTHRAEHPAVTPGCLPPIFGESTPLTIIRLIAHKAGKPFIEVRDGQPTGREYHVAQIEDGRWIHVFTDGSRGPASRALSSILIDDAIRGGVFKEIKP